MPRTPSPGFLPAFLKNSNFWVPPSGGTRGVGVGQEWVGGFEGKGYIRGAKGAGKFFPCIFLCVGQSVSGWVPLAPPPPLGWGWFKCCVCLPKVGASLRNLPALPAVGKKRPWLGQQWNWAGQFEPVKHCVWLEVREWATCPETQILPGLHHRPTVHVVQGSLFTGGSTLKPHMPGGNHPGVP